MHTLAPPALTRKPKLGPSAATHGLIGRTMKFSLSSTRHLLWKLEMSLACGSDSVVGTGFRDATMPDRSTAWFVVQNGNSSQVWPRTRVLQTFGMNVTSVSY